MAAVATTPCRRGPEAKLAGLAAAARRALAADALVISRWPREEVPSIAACDGLAGGDARKVHRALTDVDLEAAEASPLRVSSLKDRADPAARELARLGFAAVLTAPLEAERRQVGAIYALKRDDGKFQDERLIVAFARHAAIAVASRRVGATAALVKDVDALAALDELALSTSNYEELIAALNVRVAPMVSAEMTAIMVWDEQRGVLQMVAGSFGASEELAASYQITASNPQSNAARVFVTGRPYVSNTAAGDPGILQDYVEVFGIVRLLSVPLSLAGRSIGVLHLANKPEDFTIADVERAEALAPRIATVVELASTLFRLRRQRRVEEVLSNLAVAIASGENIQDFLSPALDELCVATDASLLALVPDGSRPLVLRRQNGHEELEQAVLSEAAAMPGMRAYVVGPRHAGDPGWAAFQAPVHLARQRIGTLAALRVRAEPFTKDERHALLRLANLAALAWASERYQQQRAELARLQERQRIADDLHDDVAQILFGAQLQLDAILERQEPDAEVAAGIARARGLLIRGDSAIRAVIHQLSRPAHADLPQRLTTVVSSIEADFALPIHLEISNDAAVAAQQLGRPVGEALVKVARESLVNAAKHAGPCRALVRLAVSSRGRLVLTVVDDGVGSPDGHPGRRHGLASLRRSVLEQGGTLRLHQGATGGTKITASVPL